MEINGQRLLNFSNHEEEVLDIFDGADIVPEIDNKRLTGQICRIFDCMKDGQWRTLQEIELKTGDGQSSISAQLRNLRKEDFGSHIINRQTRGDRKNGLYEYQLLVNYGVKK